MVNVLYSINITNLKSIDSICGYHIKNINKRSRVLISLRPQKFKDLYYKCPIHVYKIYGSYRIIHFIVPPRICGTTVNFNYSYSEIFFDNTKTIVFVLLLPTKVQV